jgi:predicted ATP-grasp superfamily ATP-dependent carboligase
MPLKWYKEQRVKWMLAENMDETMPIITTGAGGSGGINFARALRLAEAQKRLNFFLICTDHNPHFLDFPQADIRFISPRHDDRDFVPTLLKLAKKYHTKFLHPHPSSEAHIIAENADLFGNENVKTYLPRATSIMPDKLKIYNALSEHNVLVPKTVQIISLSDIDTAFSEIGYPLWIRAKRGAGGRLGLKVDTPKQAIHWMELNTLQGRTAVGDFILQEYLPGRDLVFDSLWSKGRLITSYTRERLQYILKHISLSGITGTPSVAKTMEHKKMNQTCIKAIRELDPEPHGFFSVDAKEDTSGNPVVTEVDGKWHTTAPLWGYAFAKALNKPELNIVYHYLMLGLNGSLDAELPKFNLFPFNHYLVRQLDAGVILKCDGAKWRIT